MSNQEEKVLAAIRAGKHGSRDEIARAAKLDELAISNTLGALKRKGVVDFAKPHPRAIDYASIRILGEEPHKHTRKRTTEVLDPPAVPPTPPEASPKDSLVGARAVVYDDGELEVLEAEVVRAEEHARFLRGLFDSIREQAPLDAEGALVVGLLARLRQAPKAEG